MAASAASASTVRDPAAAARSAVPGLLVAVAVEALLHVHLTRRVGVDDERAGASVARGHDHEGLTRVLRQQLQPLRQPAVTGGPLARPLSHRAMRAAVGTAAHRARLAAAIASAGPPAARVAVGLQATVRAVAGGRHR